ncbi:hypothetical protein ACU639_36635 [Streptomyces cynarae]|uniref:hypothetical protein n=1 Tax=Streptomyces cynarae TaxID=2981134 RepID=UPI00406C4918
MKPATSFFGNRERSTGHQRPQRDRRRRHRPPRLHAAHNGYLTDVRTGAAGALATQALSRPDSRRVALIGLGVQAGYQLRALLHVRNSCKRVVH